MIVRLLHLLLSMLLCACANPPQEQSARDDRPVGEPSTQTVFVYRACDSAPPGQLVPLPRPVPADLDPVAGAIGEMLEGVTEAERDRGCTSYFSPRTADALQSVSRSAGGDTVVVAFNRFIEALPEAPQVRSFLPPGIMAELTWTLFDQFPEIQALRLSFGGDERAFWEWLGGEGAVPNVFTRGSWEQI